MASGVRDSLITFAGKLTVMLLALATQSALAWFLGPAGRGSYAVCMVLAMILALVCMFGFEGGCFYYVAAGKLSVSEGVSHLLSLGGLGCLLAAAVGMAVIRLPLEFFSKASPESFHVALLVIPAAFFSLNLGMIFLARQDFLWYAGMPVLQSFCQLIAALVLVGLLKWGVNGALLSYVAGGATATLVALVMLRLRHGLRLTGVSWEVTRKVLSYGFRYYFSKISNIMNVQIGTIILAMLASRDEVGLFSMAMVLPVRVLAIPETIGAVILPRVAADAAGRPKLVMQCARLTGVVSGVVLLVGAVLAKWLVPVLFSPRFIPSVAIIWLLAPGFWLRSIAKMPHAYFVGSNRPGVSSIAVAVGVVTNMAGMLLLYPVLGLLGAGVATSLGYLVSSLILTGYFWRIAGLGPWELGRFRKDDLAAFRQFWAGLRRRLSPQRQADPQGPTQQPDTLTQGGPEEPPLP